jgi:predicted RNA-binding Zn-ribbon protein involved in translation (DUF1610 family)
MDYLPVKSILEAVWWLVPIAAAIGILKSRWFKGLVGEALVKLAGKLWLPTDTYHAFHNVTLAVPDGATQIDHIFVSVFGVFVVETKNMKGWIFGSEKQSQWTQKVYKQSYKFQNPLRQNYKHVKALESALDVPVESIRSVVVFAGNSKFKTPMPANVTQAGGYVRYIKSFRDSVLTAPEVQRAVTQIQEGRLQPSRQKHRQHVQQLKTRFDPSTKMKCPKCGSSMVLRTAKKGANAGSQFWGCSAYPKCKTVQNVTQQNAAADRPWRGGS